MEGMNDKNQNSEIIKSQVVDERLYRETFEVDPPYPIELPHMGMSYWVKGRSFSYVRVDCCEVLEERED
jgi:hypothetical protein